jgi:hypothetical protein
MDENRNSLRDFVFLLVVHRTVAIGNQRTSQTGTASSRGAQHRTHA